MENTEEGVFETPRELSDAEKAVLASDTKLVPEFWRKKYEKVPDRQDRNPLCGLDSRPYPSFLVNPPPNTHTHTTHRHTSTPAPNAHAHWYTRTHTHACSYAYVF